MKLLKSRGAMKVVPAVLLLVLVAGVSVAIAAEAAAPTEEAAAESVSLPPIWWIAPIGAVVALVFAAVFYAQVKRTSEGEEDMKRIAAHVREGAYAYLKRQYKVVAIFFIIVCAILYVMGRLGVQHEIVFVAFLTGGFFSGLAGFLGMKTATMASARTTYGTKQSLDAGLKISFRAGAVMGLVVVGFALLNIVIWLLLLMYVADWAGVQMSLTEITAVLLTCGIGASFQALFARVGGGIYTKAADVGADLVGKVEAGIPEDDPRNPATIADNVGDNVGDVAGMGADLFESYTNSILASSVLGVAAAISLDASLADQVKVLSLPMALAGVGIILSVFCVFLVRTKEDASMKQLAGALSRGITSSAVLSLAAALGLTYWLLGDIEGINWFGIWGAIAAGLIAGELIGKATEYYTSYDYKPTQEVAKQADTGAGTVIIGGLATGFKSTWAALLVVIVAIMAAFGFAGGFQSVPLGLYGVGIAAVGMLVTLGITLASDAYGPIADNAGGNAEMTHQPPEVRERTDALDSLGNTTAATGKGFAIGSAALTALALLSAYVEQVRVGMDRQAAEAIVQRVPAAATEADAAVGELYYFGHNKFGMKVESGTGEKTIKGLIPTRNLSDIKKRLGKLEPGRVDFSYMEQLDLRRAQKATLADLMAFYGVTLMNPKVLSGLFAGVLLVFLFTALTMKAVGRAANDMVMEVRRQFKEKPGIIEGKDTPDYARCVDISTVGAQKEMVIPSLLALVVPVGVGLVLGVGGVMGLLAGGLASGFALAIFMANAGGCWDNAKKWIETGQMGGKGSDAHKASVVGDTVGDPFKDTSGPSLNILIKLMSMVAVVFAGLTVKYAPQIAEWLHIN